MSNKLLMLKAFNQFGLNLPENTSALVSYKQDQTKIQAWISSSGNSPLNCDSFNSEFWTVLCSAEEYYESLRKFFSEDMDLDSLLSLNTELKKYFKDNFSKNYTLSIK